MSECIKNEKLQLKLLELAFYRKRSTKKMIFFQLERNDGKDREKFVFGGKLVQFSNNGPLNLTSFICNEKRALSVGKNELLSQHETDPSELLFLV